MAQKNLDQSVNFYNKAIKLSPIKWYMQHIMDNKKHLVSKMISKGLFSKGDIVIDVGCGLGGFLIELSKQFSFENILTGIDSSNEMVSYSKNRIVKEEINNISIIVGNGINLSDYYETATLIFSSGIIKHLDNEDILTFFKESYKVLEPNKLIIIDDFSPTKNSFINKKLTKMYGAYKLRDNKELKQLLSETGFINIEEIELEKTWLPSGIVTLKAQKPI